MDSNSSGLTVILDSPALVFQPKRNDAEDNNDDEVSLSDRSGLHKTTALKVGRKLFFHYAMDTDKWSYQPLYI